jgi:UDP:flavonoid glycosyltransferase YjiC (YdhE family)
MRVLFSSTFGYGHVFPMVPLARAFARAGHDVSWAAPGAAPAVIAAAGVRALPAGLQGSALSDVEGPLRAKAAALPPSDRAAFMFPALFAAGLTPAMVPDLLAAARDIRPDLLIHEQGELASPLVGAVLGVPSITHSFGGAVPSDFVAAGAERVAPLWAEYGLSVPPYAGCFDTAYLDICPASVQSVAVDHIPVRHLLRPVPYTGESSTLPAAVTAPDDRPLIYLTLGTLQAGSPVLPIAVAALRDLPVRLLVTVGHDGDPDDLGPQPPNVTVERWVPQSTLFDHCAVVVSHGGSGTFLDALSHAVPQLCLPQAADQFRNLRGGLTAGAVLGLTPDQASPEAISHAVRRLLGEDQFRTAARAVADAIARMPTPDEIVATLAALA